MAPTKKEAIILTILILTYFYMLYNFKTTTNYTTPDEYERLLAAKAIIGADEYHTKEYYLNHYTHYTTSSGLISWGPLALLTNTAILQLFGFNNIGILLTSALFTIGIFIILWKLIKNKNIALLTIALTALHPVFFITTTQTMPDTGSTFFVLLTIYLYTQWIKTNNQRTLEIIGLVLALGFLYRFQTILIIIPLLLHYWLHIKRRIKLINLAKVAMMFGLLIIPFIITQIVLSSYGLATFQNRITQNTALTTETKKVYPTDWENYYLGYHNSEKSDTITSLTLHRNANLNTVSITALTILLIAPIFIILFGVSIVANLLFKKEWKEGTLIQISIYSLLTYILFFSIWVKGLEPRYLQPIIPLTMLLIAIPAYKLLPKTMDNWAKKGVLILLVIIMGVTNIQSQELFNNSPYTENHTNIYNYVKPVNNNNYTILTSLTATKAIAYQALQNNDNIFITYTPTKRENLHKLLDGKSVQPDYLQQTDTNILIYRPPVQYVIHYQNDNGIHQLLQYNLTTEMNKRKDYKIIHKERDIKVYQRQ